MKLLHVIRSVDPSAGGPVENIKQLTGAMAEMGDCSETLTLDAKETPWVRGFPFPVHSVGPGKGTYGYAPQMVPWLEKHASTYDALIVHGIWQYHSFGCWRVLRRSNTPYFVLPHGMLDPWFKRMYPLKHAKKWLYWTWAEYRVLRDARAVLFTCEEERILARESFSLYRCQERVIDYGTSAPQEAAELQKEAFFNQNPHLRDKRLLLFLGRINPKKGCDLLIDAYAGALRNEPDWHLVIAGPNQDGLQSKLMIRAREKQLDNSITWTGMITGDVKCGAIRAAEVFVLPSHQENFGIAVAEALACGTPVLITKKVNIWREVERDGAGLVADDNLEGICSMLRTWLALPSQEKQRMRESARQCFLQRFDIKKSAQSFATTLARLIGTRSAISRSQAGSNPPSSDGRLARS
jgi:glycosyltransferase involved in cell wall biosynthesis